MNDYYRPPWYPNKNPYHNPWSIPDSCITTDELCDMGQVSSSSPGFSELMAKHWKTKSP